VRHYHREDGSRRCTSWGFSTRTATTSTLYECRHCGTTLSADTETCPTCGGEDVARTSSEGLSFRLHSLLSKTLLSGSVRPGTPRCEWQNCLSERFRFVSEADRDEILEERIEPLDVARRVGRNMSHPLDSPLKGGISSTFSMNIPPASRLEDDQWVRRGCSLAKPRVIDSISAGTSAGSISPDWVVEVSIGISSTETSSAVCC